MIPTLIPTSVPISEVNVGLGMLVLLVAFLIFGLIFFLFSNKTEK